MSVGAAPISLDEYFACETKPASELINGELIQKAMPTSLHAELQAWISYLILVALGAPRNRVRTEQNVQISEGVVLVPDVCVVHSSDVSSGRALTSPPLLCIEIVSPSDRFSYTVRKCQDYLKWGVGACWILNPESQEAWIVSLSGFSKVPADGLLETEAISLPLARVFQSV